MIVRSVSFQSPRYLKFENCKSEFVIKLCFKVLVTQQLLGICLKIGREHGRMFLKRTTLSQPTQCRICTFLPPILSFLLFFLSLLTLIDRNTCGELSLTFFPNTESMKCYGGAMSIFASKAVNVKRVLIYWDEL